jgi:hypothetical protein
MGNVIPPKPFRTDSAPNEVTACVLNVQQSIKAVAVSISLLTLVFLTQSKASAQASLASEDIINALKVGNQAYTVVRDAVRPEQWYYVPDRPRLFERDLQGAL